MLKQSENRVKIEGILSEINLTDGEFMRDNKAMPYIRGQIKIRVTYDYKGHPFDIDVPVEVFVTKWTKTGTINPAYKSIEDVRDNFVSIAAAGGEENADRVRITSGQLTENAFYAQSGELVSQTRISTSFISKIKKEDCKPEATFVTQMAIGNIIDEMDAEGMPTGSLLIKGVIVQYNERADLVTYRVSHELNPQAVDYIRSNWNQGDTVRINGIMNFSAKTVATEIESEFGDSVTEYRTVSVRELLITGGSAPQDEELAYPAAEIGRILADRKARIEKTKEPKPAQQATSAAAGFSGLDF